MLRPLKLDIIILYRRPKRFCRLLLQSYGRKYREKSPEFIPTVGNMENQFMNKLRDRRNATNKYNIEQVYPLHKNYTEKN